MVPRELIGDMCWPTVLAPSQTILINFELSVDFFPSQVQLNGRISHSSKATFLEIDDENFPADLE